MKAILKYTDCLADGKNVFSILAIENVEILKTKRKAYCIYPEITIRVKDMNELNKLIYTLNTTCTYEVSIVKVISEDSFIEKIKKIFNYSGVI